MRVESLSTAHFRNLAEGHVAFSRGVNLFVGENGQGKTNILEAIYLFKLGRSFRTQRDAELVTFGEDFCRVECRVSYDTREHETFSLSVEANGSKTVKASGRDITPLSNLVGQYPCVLFGPHDLRIVSGYPTDRRRFLDMVGGMADRSYIDLLKEYRRILSQRNAALKTKAPAEERAAWSAELIDKGCRVITQRTMLAAVIEAHMKSHAEALGVTASFRLKYDSAVKNEADRLGGNDPDGVPVSMADVFETKLAAVDREEYRRGTTLVGPHRDDLLIEFCGDDIRKFGSQGQRRLIAILLKLAELSHLETELKETAVLLLDDVFAEFDADVTEKLQHVLDADRQVFVTSPVALDWARADAARVFNVKDGGVFE